MTVRGGLPRHRQGEVRRLLTLDAASSSSSSSGLRGSGSINAGLLYEFSEEIQSESRSRSKIAGPIPISWFRENQSLRQAKARRQAAAEAESKESSSSATNIDGEQSRFSPSFRPSTLKEECLWFFLRDMAGPCEVAGEVPYLPFHLKESMLHLATKASPLDDLGVDLLLLDVEDGEAVLASQQARDPDRDAGNETGETGGDWESDESLIKDPPPERLHPELDMSHSHVSLAMLRRLFLSEPDALVRSRSTMTRLPRLRSLDLSCARRLAITPSFVSVLSTLSLTKLSLWGLPCSLYSPLESLAAAFPSLIHLDLARSDWLQWNHFEAVDWGKQWQELHSLRIANCEGLAPTPSYMNPEGRASGPAVITQALGVIREKGRRKWLDIVA